MNDIEDLLPPKPDEPLPSDCCGTGCCPCVYDIYEQDLKNWKRKCENAHSNIEETSGEQIISRSQYSKFKLILIKQITSDTFIYTFQLPANKSLDLKVGEHVIIKGIFKNRIITRPYTPITDLSTKGRFELLIKIYANGKMSLIISEWKVEDTIEARGPYGSFTYNPNSFKRIVMFAAGTGIAPMYQLLKHILHNEEDYTKLYLLYSSRNFKDILLRDDLYCMISFWNFELCHYLSQEEDISNKKYSETVELRRITKHDVEVGIKKENMENTLVLISGTKSFDKDVMNAVLNIPQISENNILKF